MTPEGKVKEMVKGMLARYKVVPASKIKLGEVYNGWYFIPVSNGMGSHGIPDFVGCYRGMFFAVETKADKTKKPTKLQQMNINAINSCQGQAFVVCDEDTLSEFETRVLI